MKEFIREWRRWADYLLKVSSIVNFRVRDWEACGRHERQTALRLGAGVQSFREMLEQLFLLWQWQGLRGGFDFSERAQGGEFGTGAPLRASPCRHRVWLHSHTKALPLHRPRRTFPA
jgi:hypothetical protein